MQGKTFIEDTYEQMRNANIVKSSEEFSTAFLGKSVLKRASHVSDAEDDSDDDDCKC